MKRAVNERSSVTSVGNTDPSLNKRFSRRLIRGVAAPVLAATVLVAGCSSVPRSPVTAAPLPSHSSYSPRASEVAPARTDTPTTPRTAAPSRSETAQASPHASASKKPHHPQAVTQGTDQNWAAIQGSGESFDGIEGVITVPADVNCRKVAGASSILFWMGVGVESTSGNGGPDVQSLILQAGVGVNCANQDAKPQYFGWAQEYVPGSQYNQVPDQELPVNAGDQISVKITAENGIASFLLQNLTIGGKSVNPYAGSPLRYSEQAPLDVADITTENTLLADGSRRQTAYWTNPLRKPTFSNLELLTETEGEMTLSQVPDLEVVSMINNGTGQTIVNESLLSNTGVLATRFVN